MDQEELRARWGDDADKLFGQIAEDRLQITALRGKITEAEQQRAQASAGRIACRAKRRENPGDANVEVELQEFESLFNEASAELARRDQQLQNDLQQLERREQRLVELAQHQAALMQPEAVTAGQLHDRPSIFIDSDARFDFVENDQSKGIYKQLSTLVNAQAGIGHLGAVFTAVCGVMGSGKTATTWRAIEQVCRKEQATNDKKIVPLYLNVDNLNNLFAKFDTENSQIAVLATALLACFTWNLLIQHGIDLYKVAELAQAKYHAKYFILHIDEFQSSVGTTNKLLQACRETLESGVYGIHVIPIMSGVPALHELSVSQVHMGPLPNEGLWRSIARGLKVPPTVDGDEFKNLSLLLLHCRGYAFLAVDVFQRIQARHANGLENQDLTRSEARTVLDQTLGGMRGVYSAARWEYVLSEKCSTWCECAPIVRTVLLCVLNKTKIASLDQQGPASGITWTRIKSGGMVDFLRCKEGGGGYLATCSWIGIWCINRLPQVQVIPPWLENPFDDSAGQQQRLALLSRFLVRLQRHAAGTRVPLATRGARVEVEVVVPGHHFEYVKDAPLTEGRLVLCAQGGGMVAALFNGFVDAQPRRILLVAPNNNDTSLTEMRTTAGELKKTNAAAKDAFVVLTQHYTGEQTDDDENEATAAV